MKLKHIIFSMLACIFGILSGVQETKISNAQKDLVYMSAQIDDLQNQLAIEQDVKNSAAIL